MVVTAVGGAEQAPVGGDAQLFLEQEFIQNEADRSFASRSIASMGYPSTVTVPPSFWYRFISVR